MSDVQRKDDPEPVRSNPEVMGRTEPRDVPAKDAPARDTQPRAMPAPDMQPKDGHAKDVQPKEMPVTRGGPIDKSTRDGGMDFWPEMPEFRHRMTDLQSEFIEEPRAAVKKAEQLVEEAVDYMARAMHEHVQRMDKDVEGNADTEKLRVMMRNFSKFFERFEKKERAA